MSLRIPAIAASACLLVWPALANDSSAELAAGGIVLTRNADVRLASEDLYISPKLVTVDYVFHNEGDKDVTTLVAFPMPEIESNPYGNISIPDWNSDNFLGFSVMIDGKPVKPNLQQRAIAAGIDVSADLAAAKVSLFNHGDGVDATLEALPQETADDWVKRGIIMIDTWDDGSGMKDHRVPFWTLQSTYWWEATFPAGKDVKVAHRYTPSLGQTAGLNFYYDGTRSEYYFEYREKYCINDAFLKALDKAGKDPEKPLFEGRLSYVLTSGGNWKNGQIGKFHLTVDKGHEEDFVSFCGTGVKKISPTRFEAFAEDFWPEKDINVLLVQRFVEDTEPQMRKAPGRPPSGNAE